MPHFRLIGGVALLALSAAGCGLATASSAPENLVPGEPTRIDFVDPATVAGLIPRTLTEGESADRRVHVSYPELPGAPELTDRLREEASRTLRDFLATRATDTHPELNVDWQIAAAGEVIGVRLRTGGFRSSDRGSGWGNATSTFWYDHGRATGSAGLLAGDAALAAVARLARDGLKERGPEVDRTQVTPDRFDSMAFNGAGDLVVEFDDCQIGSCSLGRLAVAVPASRVGPLLSETGRRAQETVRLAARRTVSEHRATVPAPSPAPTGSRAGAVNCGRARCVALTFDDGPGPHTAPLLDALRAADARATFFPVGAHAAARPGLLRRMTAEGHLIGNHGWTHRDLSEMTTSKIADSLDRTEDMLAAAVGQPPTLARAPYGAVNLKVRNAARERGLSLVGWDVDPGDLRDQDARMIADRAVAEVRPGSIVLLHDIGPATVAALPDILNRLRGKGYTFVTVPEMYGSGMQAGRLYQAGDKPARKQPLT